MSIEASDSRVRHPSRREVVRAVSAGGATVLVPAGVSVDVVEGATSSGNPELETDATVPTNTGIDITVYEDTSGDGTANNQETNSISDGVTTTEYSTLEGTEDNSYTYWMDISLSTSDTSSTPSLTSMTLTLPSDGGGGGGGSTSTPSSDASTTDIRGISFRQLNKDTMFFVSFILAITGGAAAAFRNPAAGMVWGFAFLVLIVSGILGLGLELFWITMLAVIVLLIVGMGVRMAQ